ncbi:MAG: hypothetical protein NZL89_07010, partial [Leptospiraceae bacterium]|nr:hypothetical protein [Leptospiraceae bacterium]
IRLALRLFLRYFAMKNHSKRPTANQLFWQAIKIHWLLRLFRLPYNTRQRRFIRYLPHDFPAGHRWGFSGGNALPLAACF